jgi:CRP-like cAMP-binding protein
MPVDIRHDAMTRQAQSHTPSDPLARLCGPSVAYPPGATLFREDEPSRDAFRIDDGVIEEKRTVGQSSETIIALRTKGSIVGCLSVVASVCHATSALTLTRCTLRAIDGSALREELLADRLVSECVHRLQAREAREHILRIADATLPSRLRLQRLFGDFVRAGLAVTNRNETRLNVPLSQEAIGDMIGLCRGHVSRLIREFEAEGALVRRRHWIVFPQSSQFLIDRSD